MRIEPRTIGAIAAGAGSMGTLIALIWAPFDAVLNKGVGFWGIVNGLLNPFSQTVYDFPAGGWLFIVTAVATIIFLYWIFSKVNEYFRNSHVSISVLKTTLRVTIHDKNGQRATVSRKQSFHANRRKIRAYRMGAVADHPTGLVDRTSVEVSSSIGDETISEPKPVVYGPGKALTILDRFKRELPTSLLATYLPNTWVRWIYDQGWLFKDRVVSRDASMDYLNEYVGRHCVCALSGEYNPITSAELSVIFPVDGDPSLDEVKAFLYYKNACDDVRITRLKPGDDEFRGLPDQVEYKVKKSGIRHASLAIMWNHPFPLEDDAGTLIPADAGE
jgi:hypothetical protein